MRGFPSRSRRRRGAVLDPTAEACERLRHERSPVKTGLRIDLSVQVDRALAMKFLASLGPAALLLGGVVAALTR
jgi:hypothetical protein